MKIFFLVLPFIWATVATGNDFGQSAGANNPLEEASRRFKVPDALAQEHEELHARLVKATQSGGETAKAAEPVARLLHEHFKKEELYALPPLGLLSQVSSGTVTRQMEDVLPLTEKLKREFPQMVKEHQAIVAELDKLRAAAESENKKDVVEFVDELKQHAKTEENILYPTAMLIGEMIKSKLSKSR